MFTNKIFNQLSLRYALMATEVYFFIIRIRKYLNQCIRKVAKCFFLIIIFTDFHN